MQTDRLSFRVDPEVKALVDHAAALSGQSATAFAVATLAERAREVVARHEVTTLSARDVQRFLALLESPPVVSPSLQRAAERHRGLVGDGAP